MPIAAANRVKGRQYPGYVIITAVHWYLRYPLVVLNVDKNPAYAVAVRQMKAEGTLSRRVRLRQCRYLNNVVEQVTAVKKRVWLAKAYCSSQSARRTMQGIEGMTMIRKGRVRGVVKDDALGQAVFVAEQFGMAHSLG